MLKCHFLELQKLKTFVVMLQNKAHCFINQKLVKGKGLPEQAEVAQGVPGRLRPRIF